MKAMVRRLFLIVNLRSLLITGLAAASTYLCGRFGVHTDLPLSLLATAVVFPIVFSIGSAYRRREAALDEYGSVKAHARSLFFAVRDWVDRPDPELETQARSRVTELMASLREMLTAAPTAFEEAERRAYRCLSAWSGFIRSLRERGISPSEISRCNQYLSKTAYSFERLKHFRQYRTPVTLRAFSSLFIVLLPVLCGAYFVHLTEHVATGWSYVMAVVTSLVLVSLENIQKHMEDPFDQVGEDDVVIHVEKFSATLDT